MVRIIELFLIGMYLDFDCIDFNLINIQVFVENSSNTGGLGHPFGYLKLSSNMQSVTLFVMPYNYPMLLPLLDAPIKDPKLVESTAFRQKFEKYLSTIPPYYYSVINFLFFNPLKT